VVVVLVAVEEGALPATVDAGGVRAQLMAKFGSTAAMVALAGSDRA
jgi:hypothetical protein